MYAPSAATGHAAGRTQEHGERPCLRNCSQVAASKNKTPMQRTPMLHERLLPKGSGAQTSNNMRAPNKLALELEGRLSICGIAKRKRLLYGSRFI